MNGAARPRRSRAPAAAGRPPRRRRPRARARPALGEAVPRRRRPAVPALLLAAAAASASAIPPWNASPAAAAAVAVAVAAAFGPAARGPPSTARASPDRGGDRRRSPLPSTGRLACRAAPLGGAAVGDRDRDRDAPSVAEREDEDEDEEKLWDTAAAVSVSPPSSSASLHPEPPPPLLSPPAAVVPRPGDSFAETLRRSLESELGRLRLVRSAAWEELESAERAAGEAERAAEAAGEELEGERRGGTEERAREEVRLETAVLEDEVRALREELRCVEEDGAAELRALRSEAWEEELRLKASLAAAETSIRDADRQVETIESETAQMMEDGAAASRGERDRAARLAKAFESVTAFELRQLEAEGREWGDRLRRTRAELDAARADRRNLEGERFALERRLIAAAADLAEAGDWGTKARHIEGRIEAAKERHGRVMEVLRGRKAAIAGKFRERLRRRRGDAEARVAAEREEAEGRRAELARRESLDRIAIFQAKYEALAELRRSREAALAEREAEAAEVRASADAAVDRIGRDAARRAAAVEEGARRRLADFVEEAEREREELLEDVEAAVARAAREGEAELKLAKGSLTEELTRAGAEKWDLDGALGAVRAEAREYWEERGSFRSVVRQAWKLIKERARRTKRRVRGLFGRRAVDENANS